MGISQNCVWFVAGSVLAACFMASSANAHVPSECEHHERLIVAANTDKVAIAKDMLGLSRQFGYDLDFNTKILVVERIVEEVQRFAAADEKFVAAIDNAMTCIADAVRANPDSLAGHCESEWAAYRDMYVVVQKTELSQGGGANLQEPTQTQKYLLRNSTFNLLACLSTE